MGGSSGARKTRDEETGGGGDKDTGGMMSHFRAMEEKIRELTKRGVNRNNEAFSSSSGNKGDVVDKNEMLNQCDETSEIASNVDPEVKNEEVPQECDSTADVKQMAKSAEQPQQRSQSLLVKLGLLGPEHSGDTPASENPAVAESSNEVGNVEPAGPEQVGDEPAREDPVVQLDVAAPLDEAPSTKRNLSNYLSCNGLQRTASRGQSRSNWNVSGSRKEPDVDSNAQEPYLQIEHLADDAAYAAPAPVIECVSPITHVAARVPVNEYAATALLVCRLEC